ncbi:MAG: hypothetical protein ACK5X3_14285 [Pseudomonadota bacterium]|jgi:hypothetical protein
MTRRTMSLADIAAQVILAYGAGDYAMRVYFHLGDLKLHDPDLFDGTRSVADLLAVWPLPAEVTS